MAQHAEFLAPGRRQRGKTCCHPGQPDNDGNGFEQVGDGKCAVENVQADPSNLARPGNLKGGPVGQRHQPIGHLLGGARVINANGGIVHPQIAGHLTVDRKIDHQRTSLAGIVAPDTIDMKLTRHAAQRQADELARLPVELVGHGFRDPERRQV